MTDRFPTVAAQVADWIGEEVMTGRWEPGRRITENEVAIALGVSRQPVREALRLLVDQGLVTIMPRVGAVVTEFDTHTVEEIFQARVVIESWLIRDAIAKIPAQDAEQFVADVGRWLADRRHGASEAELFDRARALRMRLMAAAGNSIGFELADNLRMRLRRYPRILRRDAAQIDESEICMRALAAAVIIGDGAGGAAAIRRLLLQTLPVIRDAYERWREAGKPADPVADGGTADQP